LANAVRRRAAKTVGMKHLWWFAVLLVATVATPAFAAPIPIRVVVVTTFEIGADAGDQPGEFQHWVEQLPLPETLPFPLGYHHLRYNPALGVLGIETGEGAERGAASIMALGSDPRFDLTKAYWVVAAVGGIDPNVASVGSAAWAQWVINADLGYELDARDMPAGFSTGIIPLERHAPFAEPAPPADSMDGQEAYELNPGLVRWAFAQTRDTPLTDTPNLKAMRAPYIGFPAAQRPPFVLIGDSLCGDRYFLGPQMNAWAERWVSYWTGGHGTFATTAEEDAGILQSLTFLANGQRVDRQRVLVLRAAGDYDQPPTGGDNAALLATDSGAGGASAGLESFDAAYRVGSTVVTALVRDWATDRDTIPTR
jgi:purine nucleoside permease